MGANWYNRNSHDFYVYTLRYPNDTVFYVGKGLAGRINEHEKEARKGIVSAKCDVIRAIWALGQEIIKQKEYESLSEKEALELEQEVMNRYDFELLTNRVKRGQMKPRPASWHEGRSQATKEKWKQIKASAWWQHKNP